MQMQEIQEEIKEKQRKRYETQKLWLIKKTEDMDQRREAYIEYMENHWRSLEDKIKEEDCCFRCGEKAKYKNDLCLTCDKKYKEYMEAVKIADENEDKKPEGEEEKKEEESKPEGEEEKKEGEAEKSKEKKEESSE